MNLDQPLPKVLIVGAGLGGLLMGILFDRVGIPYRIFERAERVKPLGALMSLSPNILAVFEQLGLYQGLLDIAFPTKGMHIFKDNMEKIGFFGIDGFKDVVGYDALVFPRPKLYDLVLSQVPAERIHYRKRVLSLQQNDNGVMIRCADNSTYSGEILIGADGAYSGVRQNLYLQMDERGLLPASDKESLSMSYVCLVGTTLPQDPERYPALRENHAIVTQIVSDATPYSWTTITVPENRLCWSVVQQLPSTVSKEELFRHSEWGPEASEAMIKEVYNFPNGMGGVMGDLIDGTPRENVSKVMLEEKLFETWHHVRTVLIGDACHKMLPSAGQGAVNAMQDAVVLANCLYDLKDLSPASIQAAFKDYRDQRFEHAKFQFETSKMNGRVMSGQNWVDRLTRKIVFNYLPRWVQGKNIRKGAAYRPQVTFLPRAPKRGTCEIMPQKPSIRYEEQRRQRRRGTTAV